MNDRHYLHSDRRTLAVRVPRVGFVFRPHSGLADESPHQDRQLVVQAVLMALWQRQARTPVNSAFESRLSIYR